MGKKDDLLKEALLLNPTDKAGMIDELIKSISEPDETIDQLWRQESERRIVAYEKGQIKTISVKEAFSKYKSNK